MEDFIPYRDDAADKLEKEMESLSVLRESLNRSDTMTHSMLGILTSFEARLSRLEETIIPIHQETGNLQRRHENIEKTLTLLDHVVAFYHVAEEVEPTIKEGPSSSLDNYLQCMEKLQKAVHYFTENNPDSPEMSHVTTLYEAGKVRLEKEFERLLLSSSKPVPPIIILDVLAVEEDEEPPVIEHLPERTLQEIKQLTSWLQNCGYNSDYVNRYSDIRSKTLIKSLQNLRDHLKSGSAGSGTVPYTHSPALTSKFRNKEHTSKKALKRMAFVRKASNALRKPLSQLEAAGLIKHGSSTGDLREEGADVDIDFYITSVSALLKLIQSEWQLMQGMIPERQQRKLFDALLQQSFEGILREGEQIAAHIKRMTGRSHAPAVISLFPVLKHLRAIKPEFDDTVEGCAPLTRNKLPKLISTLDSTGAKTLEDYLDSVRNDPDKSSNMPKDGTVHELTSNTMIFLEQLLEFADTAGAMLLTQDPQSMMNVKKADRQKLKVAEFITKVLSYLGLNLNNKSETYSDPTLGAVFMLNNYNYMLKSLKTSGMVDLVHMWNSEVQPFYQDQVMQQKRIYSQRSGVMELALVVKPDIESFYSHQVEQYRDIYKTSWSRVLHYISESQKPASGPVSGNPEGKLKDKERQAIKDRFTGFNREIDEIYKQQKTYAIPDATLQKSIVNDNKNYILPFYRAFLRKYKSSHFTKNPEKYIKYNEKQVESLMENFFDFAA